MEPHHFHFCLCPSHLKPSGIISTKYVASFFLVSVNSSRLRGTMGSQARLGSVKAVQNQATPVGKRPHTHLSPSYKMI